MSSAACEFCSQPEGHAPLCPMTYILADPNRKQAYDMGVPVSTSDWIDAALLQQVGGGNVREALIGSWSLLHKYVEAQVMKRYDGVEW